MTIPLRVLILEDEPSDAELMVRELRRAGYDPTWKCVATEADYTAALAEGWDLILADYTLPQFNAIDALHLMQDCGLCLPFIVVTGSVGEEVAVACLHEGAADYLLKQNLARLGPAVVRALERQHLAAERTRAEKALRESEATLRAVFHSSADLITIADMETGAYIEVNKGFLQATGYTRDEVIGKTGEALELWAQPEQRSQIVQHLSRGQEVRNEEIEFRKKDGTPFIGLLTADIIQVSGRPSLLCIVRDITKRKRMEETLRQSERLYETLTERSPVGIFRTDAQGRTTYVNPAWRKIAGMESLDPMENGWLKAIHPEDRERIDVGWRQAVSAGAPSTAEYRFVRPNGDVAWVAGHAVPETDAQGNVVGYIGTITDITERKRMEETLCARDAILEAIGFGAQVFLRAQLGEVEIQDILRRLGEAADVSRVYVFENYPGPNGEVYTSQRYEWCSGGITPQIDNPDLQNLPMEATGFSRWVELLSTGKPVFGAVHEFPAGERPVLEAQDVLSLAVVPIFVSGQWWGFMGFDDCRSERQWSPAEMETLRTAASLLGAVIERQRAEEALRESEERYRLLVNLSPDGIWVHRYGEILFANAAAAAIFGADSPESLIGRQALDLVAPEYRDLVRERIRRGQEERVPAPLLEEKLLRVDGTEFWAEVCAVPIEWGGESAVQVIIRDATERKRLEARLLQAQKMEVVGRLAGGVAHDFNNILTAINGYATFALEALPPSDPVRQDIQQVLDSAQRAANLTRQLLAFSRRQVIEQRVINLNDLILNLDKMLRRLIGEDIELIMLSGEGLAQVRADPGQIEQVIVNLAVNARDAMPEGGKLILETANVVLDEDYAQRHPDAKPGDYVMLAITDTGVGMSDEIKAHLFEPFFTTKETGKGTGLGLATVYGIVKQHGGNIYAYSEPGKGTTFKIYLPAVKAEAERLPRRDDEGFIPSGTETVLVVEDETLVRSMIVRTLREQGYRILEAANGNEALRLAEEYEGEIHLLMTDVVMPQMNGKELQDRFVALRPGTKVLFVSGYTDNAIAHRGILDPGVVFLQKPFTAAALVRKVRQVLDVD